ncbi:MAG: efflux RND transporter permease subunit, partial [Actinomycetota bacterium]
AVSMAVGLLVTPALALMLLPGGKAEPAASVPTRRLRERVSARSVGKTGRAFAVMVGAFVLGIAVVPFLSVSSRPSLNERELLVDVAAEPGTSLPRMTELVDTAVAEVGAVPGVESVGAHVGRAITSDQRGNVNVGELWVSLEDDADVGRTREAVERALDGQDGITPTVHTYTEARVAETLRTPNSSEAVVRVYGEDREVLRDKAEEVRDALSGVDGVEQAEVRYQPEEPTIEVEVDLERAQAYGIKPGDARRSAAALLSGITVGNLYEDQKVFDVVVWGKPEIRETVEDVKNLTVETPGGTRARLGDVASVRVAPNLTSIRHESTFTYLDVVARVRGGDVDAVAPDIRQAVAQVEFPLEHNAKLLGTYLEANAARAPVFWGTVAAAAAIFLLLQAAFSSWRLASLVFLTMPMALAGGLLATLFAGGTVTLGTVVGLVAVLGLAARNALVLIRRYQDLQWKEGRPFGTDLVVEGTRDRIVPMLTSGVAAGLLQVPFVVAGGAAGFELIRPMAVAVLGGLAGVTLYSLVVVPALYLRFGSVRQPDTAAEELPVITIPDLDQAART